MKIVFYAIGSRGDVQPSCVLASELKQRGHKVIIVTEQRLKYLVDQFEGVEFWPVQGDGCKPLFDNQVQTLLNNDVHKNLEYVYNERKSLDLSTPGRLQAFYDASLGSDIIVPSALTITEAVCVHDKLGIPYLPLLLLPTMPTGSFPHLLCSHHNYYFKILNKLSYKLTHNYLIKNEIERVANWRMNELKLAPLKDPYRFMADKEQNVILAFSERLLPGDKIPNDYFENWHITGFLFPKSNVFPSPPDKVTKFLEDGKPPIVFSLGSMPAPEPLNLFQTFRTVARRLSTRVIIIKGWTVFDDMPDDDTCIFVDSIDHNWLFKQCSCIIHHGGVGTTAAAWRSGTPSLVTWMYFDQPFWGKRTSEIGCGKSIRLQSITETTLYNNLKEIIYDNPSYKTKAMELAVETNKSNAAIEAANIVERYYKQYHHNNQHHHHQHHPHQQQQQQCNFSKSIHHHHHNDFLNNCDNSNHSTTIIGNNMNNNNSPPHKSVTTLMIKNMAVPSSSPVGT